MNLTSQYKFVKMGKGKPTPAAPAADVTATADVIKRGKFFARNEILKNLRKKNDETFQG